MQTGKYILYDSLGNYIKQFSTYQQAETYKFAKGNYSWTIKFVF